MFSQHLARIFTLLFGARLLIWYWYCYYVYVALSNPRPFGGIKISDIVPADIFLRCRYNDVTVAEGYPKADIDSSICTSLAVSTDQIYSAITDASAAELTPLGLAMKAMQQNHLKDTYDRLHEEQLLYELSLFYELFGSVGGAQIGEIKGEIGSGQEEKTVGERRTSE